MFATQERYVPSMIGTVLVLEDEALVSVMLEDFLLELGADEVIICCDAESAGSTIRQRQIDCAILDVRIGDSESFEVADHLADAGVPFLFATASSPETIVERHRHRPILAKPFSDNDLLRFLHATMQDGREPA